MGYDIIGDIHGCYEELIELIHQLGYTFEKGIPTHPKQRQLAFVGDAVDRGPHSIQTMQLLFAMQDANHLIYAPGNHCNKLYRYTKGHPVQVQHGLETTVAELDRLPSDERQQFFRRYQQFYESLRPYQLLEKGQLVIVHAGIREEMIGAPVTKRIIAYTLYGETTGKQLPDGRPERLDWARHYQGEAWIIYGHTPVKKPRLINRTANIDTGCVFGGQLSAFRYPEMEIVSVPSKQPFVPEKFTHF